MSDSQRFLLPFLDAAQAQKHVTMNEALARIDAIASATVESRSQNTPPVPLDGQSFIVGQAGQGAWSGQDNALALALNGGWVFVPPWRGWRVWIADEGLFAVFDGANWQSNYLSGSASAAGTLGRIVEMDHDIAPGAQSITPAIIPDKAIVLGVTGRVLASITGTGGWSMGVPGAAGRYGSNFGTAKGAFAHGVTSQPQAYFGGTPLLLEPADGAFTGGQVRLAVHCLEIVPPE